MNAISIFLETFAVYAGEEEDDSAVHHVFDYQDYLMNRRTRNFAWKLWEIISPWRKYETSEIVFLNFVLLYYNPQLWPKKPQTGLFARVTGLEFSLSFNLHSMNSLEAAITECLI